MDMNGQLSVSAIAQFCMLWEKVNQTILTSSLIEPEKTRTEKVKFSLN
jgi:hypothetical protein